VSGLSLALGLTVFVVALALPVGFALRVATPLAGLVAAAFAVALAPVWAPLALLATGLRSAVIALMIAGVATDTLGRGVKPSSSYSAARWAASLLLGLVVLHNVVAPGFMFSQSDRLLYLTVNPWGVAIVALTVLYWIRTGPLLVGPRGTSPALSVILVGASLALLLLMFLVTGGIIPGNTGKAAMGTGGRGLANFSTNDTASFGLALLVASLRLLADGRRVRNLLPPAVAGLAAIAVILLTQSRTALLGVGVLLVSLVTWGEPRWRRMAVAGSPLLLVLALLAYRTVKARSEADIEGQAGTAAAFMTFPGSGRAVVWASFLDAFAHRAEARPWEWAVGAGPASLPALYDDTPLAALGFVLDRVYFLPLHSDVLYVFLTTGMLGLALWLLMVAALIRSPPTGHLRAVAYGGIAVFALTSGVDMLVYHPETTALLLAAVVATSDRSAPSERAGAGRSDDHMAPPRTAPPART